MKIIAIILIIFGGVDLVGSFMDFDLWTTIGWTSMPDILWQYSSYIEIGVGYFLFSMSGKTNND
jgi:hypothetical protein